LDGRVLRGRVLAAASGAGAAAAGRRGQPAVSAQAPERLQDCRPQGRLRDSLAGILLSGLLSQRQQTRAQTRVTSKSVAPKRSSATSMRRRRSAVLPRQLTSGVCSCTGSQQGQQQQAEGACSSSSHTRAVGRQISGGGRARGRRMRTQHGCRPPQAAGRRAAGCARPRPGKGLAVGLAGCSPRGCDRPCNSACTALAGRVRVRDGAGKFT